MSYLIDGNNLMGRTPGIDLQASDARIQVLRRLAAFRNLPGRRPRRITVVFDGEPERNYPDGSVYQGIHILYALPGSTADDRIKKKVEEFRDKRILAVVTSDRSLYDSVRTSGAQVMTCEQFNRRVEGALESAGIEDKKVDELDPKEVDEWLQYFGMDNDQGE